MNRTILTVVSLGTIFATTAMAQQAGMKPTVDLPEACQSAPKSNMSMPHDMSMPQMPAMMMDGMTETQKAFQMAMTKMGPAMMQGMMASDPDVAFACAMIPHHQSAIDMSKAVLKTGHNAEIKRMAEKIISDQEKEITEFKQWLVTHAKSEGK
jgi:uncharacterized protein (DUF305 family)